MYWLTNCTLCSSRCRESRECEARVKEETKATTRNIPLHQPEEQGTCVVCGKPSKRKVYFAKAY